MKKVSNIKVALKYAEAMLDSLKNKAELEVLYNNAMMLLERKDITEIAKLDNPLWNMKEKTDILATLANRLNLCQAMLNTLKILAENSKLKILPQVLQQFVFMYQQQHNIAQIEVTTVAELSQAQDDLLKEKLKKIFNKEVIIKYIIEYIFKIKIVIYGYKK